MRKLPSKSRDPDPAEILSDFHEYRAAKKATNIPRLRFQRDRSASAESMHSSYNRTILDSIYAY